MKKLYTWLLLLAAAALLPLGDAWAQDCAVDFETLNFGAVLVGSGHQRVLTVTNEGSAVLPLDLAAQPCPGTPAFSVVNSGHFDVQPGASQAITIAFSPASAGLHLCELDLGTNDCPPVTLTGWGQAAGEPQGNHIGLYLDPDAQICQSPLDGPGQTVVVHILAVLPDFEGSGISACEFTIANLPPNAPPAGIWSVTWTTDLVIGNLETGVALAWPDPPSGPIFEIGTLTFMSFVGNDWIGPDHTLSVGGLSADSPILVDFDTAQELFVGGGDFTFNCTNPPACPCYEGGEPLCVLQPSALEFGVVNIGSYSQQNFTIWNQGGGILAGFISEACPDFAIINGGGAFSLGSGQSRSVLVRFSPQAPGEQSCSIDLGTADCPELACTGTGYLPVPICEVTPASLAFDDLAVGDAQDLSVVIRNAGQGVLAGTVSEDCPDFSLLAGAGAYALAANQTRTVTLRFAPSAPGAYECTLDLGSAYCETVPCTGSAHAPVFGCALDPAELDFGDIALGSSAYLQASLENTGDLPLVGTLSVSDPNYSLVQGGGAYNLAPGATRSFTVRYTPLDYGPHPAVVATGNATCGELPLIGQAHEAAPTCEITPPSLDFGELLLGNYAIANFIIANYGDGPLVGEVTLASDHFHLLSGGGAYTLQSGQLREVILRYDPTSYGLHTAAVDLGAAACATVPLRGFARNPAPGGDHVGLYLDTAGAVCAADAPVGTPLSLHLIAVVPSFADPGITGAEFRVAGLAALNGLAEVGVEWDYPPTGGDIATGIRFDFAAPQAGALIELGRLVIDPLVALPANLGLSVERSTSGDQLRISDGEGLGWDVGGDRFTLNCTEPELCACLDFGSGTCELSTTALDFGTVAYGATSFRSFSLTNAGFAPLAGELAISGTYFHLSEGAGPFLLDPGETLMAEASFQPFAPGQFTGLITTGLADCPEILCTGTGTAGSEQPFLGIFADEYATICELDQQQYVNASVYVSVVLPEWLPAITAAEFRVENLPPAGNQGIVTYDWNTVLVIGNPGYGIALAFNPPLSGPLANLGRVDFFEIDPNWLHEDYRMEIAASISSGQLVVVGPDYVEYECRGGLFTFNCTGSLPGGCSCQYATPVLLSDFSIEALPGAARIRWSYEGGGDAEFRLEGERDGLSWQVPWQEMAPGQYEALDEAAALAIAGSVNYRLWGRLAGESWQPLRDEQLVVAGLPRRTALLAAHPNPFNPSVTVPFTLGAAGRARLGVYDVAGRQVRSLLDAEAAAGPHAIIWDGRDESGRPAGSGVYFVRLEAAGVSESQKLVLLR